MASAAESDGSAPQTVSFVHPVPSQSYLHKASIVGSVTVTTGMRVNNDLVVSGARTNTATADVYGTLTLKSGSTLTNPGALRYAAYSVESGVTISGDAPIPLP